jgi:hypothetical protein
VSPSFPIVAGISAVAITGIAATALFLFRQVRLRRHLHRLRTLPLEQGERE